MIKYIEGDILELNKDIIICQQVNCRRRMGSGLAKQIREKYPEVYQAYLNYCPENKNLAINVLGTILVTKCHDDKIVANLFGQLNYGYNKDIVYTDYKALSESIYQAINLAYNLQKPIAFPYNIGCGLANGNWDKVYKIIESIANDVPNVIIFIIKYNKTLK